MTEDFKYKTDPKDLQVGDVCLTSYSQGGTIGSILKTIAVVYQRGSENSSNPEPKFKDIAIVQGKGTLGETWEPVNDDSLLECELLFSVSRLTIEEQALEKLKEVHPEYTL